jgi:hypothetical protein
MPTFGRIVASTQAWAKAHGALTGLIGLVTGTALGLVTPLWQTYWVDTPRLNAEIYTIDRLVAPDARLPSDDESISVLMGAAMPFFPERGITALGPDGVPVVRGSKQPPGLTPEQADTFLAFAKGELKNLPQRIEERQKQLQEVESLSVDRITPSDVDRLNFPIEDEFDMTSSFSSPSAEGQAERQRAVAHYQTAYRERVEQIQKRYSELQSQLPLAERRLEEMKRDLETKKGYFQLTAILNNTGRKSISIRQIALLRIYIGKGNYVDLQLELKDYQTAAEIGPSGTRLAVFTSETLDKFTDGDRVLVSTYWGQSVHAILFIEDVEGAIHASNRISFAKGLYIREVFDRLTAEAAKPKYRIPDD